MSIYWNKRVKNLSPYVPGEQPRDRKFIKLNTNENPYPPSPKVIEAVQKAVNGDLRLYPDPDCAAFREAAARRYGVMPGQIFAGNGSDEILGFAFGAFFESIYADGPPLNAKTADVILFPDITYSFYPVYAGLWNIPYRQIHLRDDFYINCDDYRIPCAGIIFPNPNAPTGIPVPLADILSLAECLETQGRVLIIDEAYIAFSAQSAVPFINEHPNLLVVHTLSKSASLAGMRFGYAVGDEELITGLCRIRDSFNSYTIDRLALAAAAAAVADASYYDKINNRVIATRERTAESLKNLKFNVLQSAANFLFIKAPKISGRDLFCALREKGILARHFNKEKITDYLRVSIGTDEDMDEFIAACEEILNRI